MVEDWWAGVGAIGKPLRLIAMSLTTRHTGCVRCGYDLAGLPRGALCPECGTPGTSREEAIDAAAVGDRRGRYLAQWIAFSMVVVIFAVFIFVMLSS